MNKKLKIFIIAFTSLFLIYVAATFILENIFENKIKQAYFDNTYYQNFAKNKNQQTRTVKVDNKDFTYHYFENNNSNKTIVLTHGITVNKSFVSPVAQNLFNQGYNIVLYDLRTNGDNKHIGTIPTFSTFESEDLHKIILDLKHNHPQHKINLYGVSMGAATTIKYAQKYDKENLVTSYIAESSYDSMFNQLNEESKSTIPIGINIFAPLMDLIIKIKHNYNFADARLDLQMNKIKHPMLLISPNKDPRINYQNSIKLYKRANSKYVSIKLFNQHKHALSFTQPSKDEFFKILNNFYQKVNSSN